MMQKSKDFKLNVYTCHTRQRPKVNGQLVMLGYDVTTCTPASYQRARIWVEDKISIISVVGNTEIIVHRKIRKRPDYGCIEEYSAEDDFLRK